MIWSILQNLGITTIILVAVGYFSREVFKQVLDRDLEKFKSDLERESIEFKIRYEHLHAERMEVIKETHKGLVQTYRNFLLMISPLQIDAGTDAEQKRQQVAFTALLYLTNYFEDNAIFFEPALEQAIQALISDFQQCWREYTDMRMTRETNHKEALQEWGKVWEHIRSNTPQIQINLKNKFREVLGIQNEN